MAFKLICILCSLFSAELLLQQTSLKHQLDPYHVPRGYFTADGDMGYDITPNFSKAKASIPTDKFEYDIWSNELGCFDEPYRNERDYVLLVGNSFTHYMAPFEVKWGTQLEKLIENRILKCGVGGFSTHHQWIKTKKIIEKIKLPPKLIIVGYYVSDFRGDSEFPASTVIDGYMFSMPAGKGFKLGNDWSANELSAAMEKIKPRVKKWEMYCDPDANPRVPILAQVRCWLNRNSVIYHAVKRLKASSHGAGVINVGDDENKNNSQDEARWQVHYENLQKFKSLAKNYNSKLLFVLIPSKWQTYPEIAKVMNREAMGQGSQLIVDRVAKYLEKHGIEYLDLSKSMPLFRDPTPRPRFDPDHDLYWEFDGHPSFKGNRLMALLAAEHLLRADFSKQIAIKKELMAMCHTEKCRNFYR